MADTDIVDRSGKNIEYTKTSGTIKDNRLAEQEKVSQAALIQRIGCNPGSLSAADVKQLQRAIGNQAVSQLMESLNPIQAVGEISEQEERKLVQGRFMTIQRVEEAPQGEEEEPLQGKMAEAFNTEFANVALLSDSDPGANIDAPADMQNADIPRNFFTGESPSSGPVIQKIGLSKHFKDVHYATTAKRARTITTNAGRKKNTVVKNSAANNVIIGKTKAQGDNFTFVNVAYWNVNNGVAAHVVGNIVGNTNGAGDAHHIA